MEDGSQIEFGTIGREGTSALPLIMGASSTANICYCQVRGRAIEMPAAIFRELAASDVVLRQRLDRYLQADVNILGHVGHRPLGRTSQRQRSKNAASSTTRADIYESSTEPALNRRCASAT